MASLPVSILTKGSITKPYALTEGSNPQNTIESVTKLTMNQDWRQVVDCHVHCVSIDEKGHLILCLYVDLRPVKKRTPIHEVVKGCEKKYAIELGCDTILTKKPAVLRNSGRGLIRDKQEGHAVHSEVAFERKNDPDHLESMNSLANEANKVLLPLGATLKIQSTNIQKRDSDEIVYGNNWWIYSTTVTPNADDQWRKLQGSLDPKYDHFTRVSRLRGFAQALGETVCEHIGPQCAEATYTHTLGAFGEYESTHEAQWIIHGPVVYEENTFKSIDRLNVLGLGLLAQIFVKNREYVAQREYRFAILTESEASSSTLK